MFDSVEDVSQKLGNTVIFLNKKPIYVLSGGWNPSLPPLTFGSQGHGLDSLGFYYLPLPITEKERINSGGKRQKQWHPVYHPDVDFRSISSLLGYVNYFGDTKNISTFIARIPTRQSIQGISTKNIHYYTTVPGIGPPWTTMLETKTLIESFENKYPGIDEAYRIFERDIDKTISIAFHKNFAVNKKTIGPFFLEYKGQDIGWSTDFNKFALDRKFNHLREVLEYNCVAFK